MVCPGSYPQHKFLHPIVSNNCLALVVTKEPIFRRPQRDHLGTFSCINCQRSGPLGCLQFLEETSERDDVWWTASASADGAYGLNRVSLAGLCVEKSVTKMHPPCTEVSLRWVMKCKKFLYRTIFMRNGWYRSVTLCYNVTTPSGTLVLRKLKATVLKVVRS